MIAAYVIIHIDHDYHENLMKKFLSKIEKINSRQFVVDTLLLVEKNTQDFDDCYATYIIGYDEKTKNIYAYYINDFVILTLVKKNISEKNLQIGLLIMKKIILIEQ